MSVGLNGVMNGIWQTVSYVEYHIYIVWVKEVRNDLNF